VAKFLALLGEQLRKRYEGFFRIDHAGGVIGRIDDDGLGSGGQHSLQPVHGDLKIRRSGRNDPEFRTGCLHKRLILREEGGNSENFAAGHCQGMKYCRQLRGCTAADDQLICRSAGREPVVQIVGNGLPGGKIADGRGVTVDG